ncbi:hypothetical protein WJM97_23245 (plasmid) [Okeanomitos corallinicola TIOX110]|uniref:Uncharacterized protein n=1 Tax=Okeanomitos corallinicola TIOX110 TaxID=3133117 RepID=A0ABZ2V3L7_9CYAN
MMRLIFFFAVICLSCSCSALLEEEKTQEVRIYCTKDNFSTVSITWKRNRVKHNSFVDNNCFLKTPFSVGGYLVFNSLKSTQKKAITVGYVKANNEGGINTVDFRGLTEVEFDKKNQPFD